MFRSSCSPVAPITWIAPFARDSRFVQKNSPTLLSDLRNFLVENVGFGDFVFRLPDQTEVGRASDLNQLEQFLHTVPEESIAYHAERNHFSHWFMTRTEFALAQKLRPRKVSDFSSVEELRQSIIDSIAGYRDEQSQAQVGDFNPASFQTRAVIFPANWQWVSWWKGTRSCICP